MSQRNEQERRREVEQWQRSGQPAGRYASAHGYSATSLLKWAAAARREHAFVRLEVSEAPRLGPSSDVIVEIGAARVRVAKGFDAAVLRQVVAALSASEGS